MPRLSLRRAVTVLPLVVCLFFLACLTSCAGSQAQLEHARQLEGSEHWKDAVVAYNRALTAMNPSLTIQLAEIHGRIGHCLIELGRGTDALVELEKALALDSANVNAHLRLAQLFIAAGVPQQSEPHIQYVAALQPRNPQLLELRGAMYAAEGRDRLAERDLLHALAVSTDRNRVAQRLSDLYLRQDKRDKARDVLARAAEKSPHKSRLLLSLARLQEIEGDAAAAEKSYREAVALEHTAENCQRFAQFLERNGRIAEAEAVLAPADRVDAASPSAHADLQFQIGHTREALRAYQSAFGQLTNSGSSAASSDSQILQGLAARMVEAELVLASAGDPSGVMAARKQLEHDAQLAPSTRSLLAAEIDIAAGDLPAAERVLNEAAQQHAGIAQAHYLLGTIAVRRGQHADAVNHWRAALAADDSYVPARLVLAEDAIKRHDGSKAEEYVIDVVRDEPANVDALLLYARALLLAKRYDSARALCGRVLAADRNNSGAALLLGDIALQQHQLAMALLQYEKAMLLEPQSEDAIKGLTAVYQKGGAGRTLLHKLEKLAVSGAPSSRLMEITGRLYASLHMEADAKRCLRRAAEMDPGRQSAKLALGSLYADDIATRGGLIVDRDMQDFLFGQARSALIGALRADQRRDQAEAIRQYETVVRAGDPDGIASNNLAWLYAQQGKHLDRALQLAQHALELNPGSPQVLDTVGVIQLENRQFTKALASFESGARRAAQLQGMADLQHTIEGHLAEARQLAGQPADTP
jgi:tetratricopeptide (TPR) repeat protein